MLLSTTHYIHADNTFDYVWSHNVLEHVNPAKRYLEEIHRVLKPGGLFWAKYAFAIYWCHEGVVCVLSLHVPPQVQSTLVFSSRPSPAKKCGGRLDGNVCETGAPRVCRFAF